MLFRDFSIRSDLEGILNFLVKERHHSGEGTTDDIGNETLVKSLDALGSDDGLAAVEGTLVDSLLHGLLGLHLESPTDGVEGVVEGTGGDTSDLGGNETRDETEDTNVLLVGVESHDGIEETELETTVHDDTSNGGTESIIDGNGSLIGSGLGKAVDDTVEGLLSGADVGGETSTGKVKRVADGEGSSGSETGGGKVNKEEHSEVGLGRVLGEEGLDGILEGEVEGLLGEVPDDVGTVSTPERGEALLGSHTGEAVSHAGVAGDLTGANEGIGILGLNKELDTLNGSGGGLSDGTDEAADAEVQCPS